MNKQLISLLEQGYQFQNQRMFDEAKANYLKVLSADHNNEFALNLLGVVAIEQGEVKQAITYLEKALLVNDKDAETHNNLGLCFKALNDYKNAIGCFSKAIVLMPNNAVYLNNLANSYASLNQHEHAVQYFEKALNYDGQYIECIINFSTSLLALSAYAKALDVLHFGLSQQPKNARLLAKLGEVYKAMVDYESAENYFKRSLAIDNFIPTRIQLSTVLKQLGQLDEAISLLKNVLSEEENNSEALNRLGVIYEQLGDSDKAAMYFRLALYHTPNHAISFYQLSKLKDHKLTTNEVRSIKNLLDDESILPLSKFSLWLALSCHFEKLKQYENSFECIQNAKRIKANDFPYQSQLIDKHIGESINVFTNEHQRSEEEYLAITPIFIVGMPRSGTTLTEQILSSHSQIAGAGEVGFINEIAEMAINLTKAPYPQCVTKLSNEHCLQLREHYLAKIKSLCGSSMYYVDKNPLNYNMLGFILYIFPNAKFVYCKREAIDNCVSIFKLPFDDNQTYCHDLEALAHYYQAHERLMSFWLTKYPERIITCEYESTVNDLNGQAHRLIDFVGLDFQEDMLTFYKNKRIVLTPSAEQVRQPIYRSSVGAWKKYANYLAPLMVLRGDRGLGTSG